MIPIIVNGKKYQIDVESDTPLLWTLRENLGLTGTKFGCGIAQCGACTVHVDGHPVRSCITPIESVKGKKITTIEGLSPNGNHPLQKAWIAEEVPQCGYCQSGQIMSAAALLSASRSRPTPISTRRCRVTSAAAEPTSASGARFTAPRAISPREV
jgi:isoquinoline 1-oxidoreductase subunit alpha